MTDETNVLAEVDPIDPSAQGLILLDGSGLPLIVLDEMEAHDLADYLSGMTLLQLSAMRGRVDVLSDALSAAIEHRRPNPFLDVLTRNAGDPR